MTVASKAVKAALFPIPVSYSAIRSALADHNTDVSIRDQRAVAGEKLHRWVAGLRNEKPSPVILRHYALSILSASTPLAMNLMTRIWLGGAPFSVFWRGVFDNPEFFCRTDLPFA